MHAIYLATNDQECQLYPHPEWFHDSGIAPDGQWWIAPTHLFLEQVWQGCAGDNLKKLGFRLRHDGHHIGATQNTVIYLPAGAL